MAGQAPTLSPALHAHLGLLAQSGRALLRLDHPGTHPTRRLHFRSRARSGHPPIPRPSQCRPQALRLDQIGGRNPRKSHPCARCARTACFRESSVKSATLALQRDALTEAGCAKIFTEQTSGAVTDRPALHDALEYARSGDTLIVWKLDSLARSMKQLIETVETLRLRGIGFRSLTEALDTTTAQGGWFFTCSARWRNSSAA